MHIDGYVHALDARWGGSGVLPDAGLLVHILDGWEDHGAFGNLESTDQSSSLLFAANGFLGGKIPIYHGDSREPGIIPPPASYLLPPTSYFLSPNPQPPTFCLVPPTRPTVPPNS